jgi:hypothetical protein
MVAVPPLLAESLTNWLYSTSRAAVCREPLRSVASKPFRETEASAGAPHGPWCDSRASVPDRLYDRCRHFGPAMTAATARQASAEGGRWRG